MCAILCAIVLHQCGPEGCATTPARAVVQITVTPPGARVWINDHAWHGRGRIVTPPLEPGWRYRYRVVARWGDVERQWMVYVEPGQTVHAVLSRDEPVQEGSSVAEPHSEPHSEPQNFGVDLGKLRGHAGRVTLGGREITLAEATQALKLADDSGKLRLTVIGEEADRRRVLDDLKGPLADIASQCLVQDYPPDHWAVANVGFHATGKPTIYLQSPDGTVLHRQDDYADGAAGFRQAFERLRRPDPNYRPDKDRDLRRPADGILARFVSVVVRPFRAVFLSLLAVSVAFVLIAVLAKGWFFYLLGWLISLVPGPPSTNSPSVKKPTASKLRTRRGSP